MEHTRTVEVEEGAGEMAGVVLHDDQREHLEQLKKILRRSLVNKEQSPDDAAGVDQPAMPDVSSALDLVHRAASKMRANEDRARDREAQAEALAQRAQQALEAAEARVHAADARTRAAESRAQEADARAKEAEDYFRRLCEAIEEQFS